MQVVVVGNGIIGHKVCEKLITKSTGKNFEIIFFWGRSKVCIRQGAVNLHSTAES